MSPYWILMSFSWFGTVTLQYINTGGPGAETVIDPFDASIRYPPLPYLNYFNLPASPNELQSYQNGGDGDTGTTVLDLPGSSRKRRTVENGKNQRWVPNLVDTDKTLYLKTDSIPNPFIVQAFTNMVENRTDDKDKKNFSPWGGKRNKPSFEQMWSWKRSANLREPTMPKRVRFSPWGGKRSGQMIHKAGSKGSKIIFATTIPELNSVVTNYSPSDERAYPGLQFIPLIDKRHPLLLALTNKVDDGSLREAMPFNTFLEAFPKIFKIGHPYTNMNLKRNGKRKVKFSTWGGKRSPPIIGPIWTPASQDIKETILNAILLMRGSPEKDDIKNF